MKLSKYVLALGILTATTAPYALTSTEASAATKTMSGVVSKDVIVRASSTPKSTNLGTLSKGTNVTIYKETTYWYQVKFNNKLAYISKDHVKKNVTKKATTSTAKKTTTKTISVVKSKKTANATIKSPVYYYATASTKGKKLGTLKKGTKIHINSISKYGWVEFDNNGTKNYVYKDFVTKMVAKKTTTKPVVKKTTTTPKTVAVIKSKKAANATIKSPVYYYATASTKGKKLGTLKKGTKIHINSTSKYGWVEFDNNGTKNYVYKDFVTKTTK
ncbi:MAG: SH3 domain-containing protein [Kurthia sp.]|nr:SH3 domain-containing protein [Candidatus Kurthia equi]